MSVVLGIDFKRLMSMTDEMEVDSNLALRRCVTCNTSFATHAFVVQTVNAKTTNAAYCHACVPPKADAKATLVLDKQELVHAHNFIIEHLPHNPLDYDHPLAKNEWLAALAKKVPYVKPCEAPNGERLSYSLDEYKIAVAEIKSYHNNPFTAVEEMKESVDQVMKGLRSSKGKYPRLHPFALHGHEHVLQLLMLALRANEPKMFKIDKVSSTLAFFSADGSVTDWHFDWTEARNVALGVEDWPPPQADAVAAFWYFVCPQYISAFMDHLQEIEVHEGRTWQETDYAGFVIKYPGAMLCLKQKLQDEVYVPPGWLHAVFTKLPCVKLAWDFFAIDNAALYMAAWRHVGAPFAQKRGSLNSVDFMYAGDAVVQASTNAA